MPLARIITDSVDDSLELTMQLRARGFVVETVSPDQIPQAPADLEVRLEECSPEDVLSKAAQVTESEDLWVFVAPGALDERARPVRTIPLLPHAFDVSFPAIAPKREGTFPVEAGTETDFELPAMHASTAHELGEVRSRSGNGGARNEIAADLKSEPAAGSTVIPPMAAAKPTPETQPAKVKVVVLPKAGELAQIPEVPERLRPIGMEPVTIPVIGRMSLRGPYKISFRTGPRFWKAIAVAGPLAVVAGVLVAVAAFRPHLPPAIKSPMSSAPSASSAGVKPSKAPQPPPSPLTEVPKSAKATDQTPSHVTSAAVPKVAAKPVTESPATPTAKTSQVAAKGASSTPAASPVAKDSGPAQTAVVNKTQPPRRHTATSEADIVAEDTVVFYDRKPTSPRKSAQNPNVKR